MAMAASAFLSSSSSSHPCWTYDVFLSFRGGDTRKNFTDHLYSAFKQAGINTFRDDNELRRGEDIASELSSAIQGSRISVIVFSKNYADSRWCLEELVKIMECRITVRQRVLPIFYDVEPSDVRKQTGSFAQAFLVHEQRYLSGKVLRWREALTEVANLSGLNLADKHEAKFIRQIVEAVSRELNSTYLYVTRYPVGVDCCVQDITSLLRVGANDVRMVGIWGMGGTGKTTISKAIYNHLFHSFDGKSFLVNIRETCKQHDGHVRLQKQLLSDILKTSKIEVNNVDRGIVMIQERLRGKRVLVILDDVEKLEQLNAIAGSRDWFGPGSRIIITTRDEHLLKSLEVDEVYKAKEMSENESLELFSWHAFRNSDPIEEYMHLSRRVVAYSGGLPLALEVLGSFLSTKRNHKYWESALEKLERIPDAQIQEKLKISFDALSDSTEKDIFLDISCFFIGMDKNYVIQILDACGFFPEIGISVLIQRCLLSISEKNKLIMHDLLRDMGREIVRQECPNKPGKCSRLWWHEDAFDILDNHQGTEEVEGLALKFSTLSEVNFSTTEFIKMKRLRLLQLDNVHLTGDYEHLSKELRWLRWHGFPLKFLPNNFYSRKLVAIDLRYSNLTQVWENSKQQFEKLKFLNLGHSHDLRQTPNFARLPNLEKLILKNCTSLFEVHQSIGDLNNLVLVNLKGCRSLESLPKSFYRLKSLQTLILSGCSKFDNLADELGEMESLTTFLADNTAIRQVPCTIVQLKNLKYWSMYGCKGSPRKSPQSVNMLPASLQGLNSLTELNLGYCNLSDDAIPKDLWSLYSLESLNLQNNHFHSLPSSLGGLSKLQSLELDHCTNLRSIPDLPPSLGVLGANDCTMLERVPNISNISTLEILDFTNCKKLVEIPGLNNLLKSMADILLRGCSSLTNTFKQSILQELTLRRDGFRYNIFLPGNDIPDVFMYKNEGPSVCFEMPHNIYGNMEGFTVCIVYSLYPGRIVAHDHPTNSITVINYTKSRTDTESLFFANTHDHEDHMWQASIYNTWFNLEAGDQVKFIVDFGSQINVKKIGVGLIYDKVIDETMIHYASTSNKDAIVVIDDKDQVAIESKRGIGDDKAESSHLLFSSAAELLDLSRDEADRVATILHFAHNINNRNQIDFRSLVTDANIKKYFGYSILKDKPPLKRQSKKFLRKKNIKAEKSKVDKTRVEKAKIGKTKAEEARIEKAKTEKGKVAKRNKPSKATSPRAIATEVLRSDVPASTPGISPSPPSKPSSEAQPCPNVNVLEDPPHKLPTLPESSLVGRSFTGLKGIPNLKELLASVDDDSESSGSDSTREPQVPKKLMGDAIRTGGEGLKGVGLRFKTLATKKHQSMDHGKGKHPITSKRPQYEDMSRKVCNILRSSHESYPRCEVPIPSSFLNISVEATPSQMDAEIHHISDNSEPGRDEREGEGANSRPPTSPQTQNFGRVSPEPRPILETNATKIPLKATEQSAWGVPESVLASSANPASGAVPSIQLPLTSPKGDMKLPIHSLKDGLLGCPLQALQALAPEGYLQGDVGKTTPDRFADILVHHQIAHAVKLAVLYQEYRDHQSKYPQELAQMRTQLKSLDFEVAKLKPYEVEVGRLWELPAAKEVELTESQRARTSAETKVADYDNLTSQLTEKTEECSLLYAQQEKIDAKLTKKLEECIFLRTQIDETETRLADAEIQCSDLQAKLTTIGTQKDETEARLVDTEIQFSQLQAKLSAVETQLLVERKEAYENFNVVIHELKETKGKYFKLRKRYHHYKGKAIRFLKQLSLTTWYRDHSWARGFHWGFESFRTIASNPSIFKVDFKTVSADYLPPPEQATEELHDLGKDLFPDVPRWTNDQADYPEDPSLPSVPIDDSDSDSDNYAPDA